MLIGEVAKYTGNTKASIRHYVDIGLLKPSKKRAGMRNYQEFSQNDIERLKWISMGKTMGFTLREIGPYLDLFMSGKTPENGWKKLFSEKLQDIEIKIAELEKVRDLLRSKLN